MGITLEIKRTLNASQQKVFEALTEKEQLMQWFGPTDDVNCPRVEFDKKIGGQFLALMKNPKGDEFQVEGKVEAYEPFSKVAYTWQWAGPDTEETLVTYLLEAKGEQTELTLIHERFSTEDSKEKHAWGWNGSLKKLSRFISG